MTDRDFITIGTVEMPSRSAIAKLMGDHEGRRIMAQEGVMVQASERICHYMEEQQKNLSQLSEDSGVKASKILRFFKGHDITLRELASLAHALNVEISV